MRCSVISSINLGTMSAGVHTVTSVLITDSTERPNAEAPCAATGAHHVSLGHDAGDGGTVRRHHQRTDPTIAQRSRGVGQRCRTGDRGHLGPFALEDGSNVHHAPSLTSPPGREPYCHWRRAPARPTPTGPRPTGAEPGSDQTRDRPPTPPGPRPTVPSGCATYAAPCGPSSPHACPGRQRPRPPTRPPPRARARAPASPARRVGCRGAAPSPAAPPRPAPSTVMSRSQSSTHGSITDVRSITPSSSSTNSASSRGTGRSSPANAVAA